ncbi:UxaA family hydrolase [bacterium LRH843]|nr:UxaA family hydrolase [bacterium LRH843]
MTQSYNAVMIKPNDNVATALELIPADSVVNLLSKEKKISVKVLKDIEFGHKFAVAPIAKGENVLKYGEIIGRATENIKLGDHVHMHNLEGIRGRGDQVAANEGS